MGLIALGIVIVVVATVAAFFVLMVWMCVKVIGWTIGAFAGTVAPKPARGGASRVASLPAVPAWAATVLCPQQRCRAVNAPHARFCRRCGMAVSAVAAATAVGDRTARMR